MHSEVILHLREVLNDRVENVKVSGYQAFSVTLKHLFSFIDGTPIVHDIIQQLIVRYPDLSEEINQALTAQKRYALGQSYDTDILLSYFILKRWSEGRANQWEQESFLFERTAEHNARLMVVQQLFLLPLAAYISEHLAASRIVLNVLRRYKQRTEWFHRNRMLMMLEEDTRRGEQRLAYDLYEYLFDQGIDFVIEPSSVSGEVDLIAQQGSHDPLIADAKVFDPAKSKGRPYIVKGFNQVYTYTRDYNEPFAYLVIFRICSTDLRFDVSGVDSVFPYIRHNGKTIFFVVIDIHNYKTSASKRGPLESVVISENELIQVIEGDVHERVPASSILE